MSLFIKAFLTICLCLLAAAFCSPLYAVSLGLEARLLLEDSQRTGFPLVETGQAAAIYVDASDHAGVLRVAADLCADIERVSSCRPELRLGDQPTGRFIVILGTLGKSELLENLSRRGKIDTAAIIGKWESFSLCTVSDPFPNVEMALVIMGSDKRGAIYGAYELSEQIGVSPWYWWADVPVRPRASLSIRKGVFVQAPPAVQYRGIFINDEAPCLTAWAKEKFGGFNSKFYARVFELMLRLRANYLWPAMWDNAFNEDDPENPRLADEYGIVMGTSHHEPMMRAHKEWTSRSHLYGNGKWNYQSNSAALQVFFREGIARNKDYENLVTVGLRGDGDEGMVSTGSIESDIAQLKKIFTDQRQIIAEEMHKAPEEVPQIWALFTEVQKYYEQGLRPPDDVTLLWTDDNTGNVRRLPTEEERKRKGGSGIYYHIDMHGGPFAYQWINTNPLPKMGEQLNLAYEYGANKVWILNVGDLKPLEVPLEFFLRLAWDPAALNKDKIQGYMLRWAEREFGPAQSAEIADILRLYAKYNGWRKPELLTPDTFSALNYEEAALVEKAWLELSARAEKVYASLPAAQRDAFYQLILHPTKASAIVARLNILAGRNHLFAKQGRASTNLIANQVKELFGQDRALSAYYNDELASGKWRHLMSQPHLGQYNWEPPVVDVMPAVAELIPDSKAQLGVSIEGSPYTWPFHYGEAVLPAFDSFQPRKGYFDVFEIGQLKSPFTVSTDCTWLSLKQEPMAPGDYRYWVEVDWAQLPAGSSEGLIRIESGSAQVQVKVPVNKASSDQLRDARGCFATLNGVLAFAATAYERSTAVGQVRWEAVPDYGRGEAAMAIYPVTAPSLIPPAQAPQLEYPIYLSKSGVYELTLIVGPVMDFVPDRGMRIGISLDAEAPLVSDLFENREAETFLGRSWWNQYTRDNARYLRVTLKVDQPGRHVLKLSMIDPNIVVQKLILSDHPLPYSCFGPPLTPPSQ